MRFAQISLAGGCVALLVAASSWAAGDPTSGHQYVLHQGDSAVARSIDWTCLMSTSNGRPLLTCSRNRKPISSVTIEQASIIVGTTSKPTRIHGGYRFKY